MARHRRLGGREVRPVGHSMRGSMGRRRTSVEDHRGSTTVTARFSPDSQRSLTGVRRRPSSAPMGHVRRTRRARGRRSPRREPSHAALMIGSHSHRHGGARPPERVAWAGVAGATGWPVGRADVLRCAAAAGTGFETHPATTPAGDGWPSPRAPFRAGHTHVRPRDPAAIAASSGRLPGVQRVRPGQPATATDLLGTVRSPAHCRGARDVHLRPRRGLGGRHRRGRHEAPVSCRLVTSSRTLSLWALSHPVPSATSAGDN